MVLWPIEFIHILLILKIGCFCVEVLIDDILIELLKRVFQTFICLREINLRHRALYCFLHDHTWPLWCWLFTIPSILLWRPIREIILIAFEWIYSSLHLYLIALLTANFQHSLKLVLQVLIKSQRVTVLFLHDLLFSFNHFKPVSNLSLVSYFLTGMQSYNLEIFIELPLFNAMQLRTEVIQSE